MTDALKKLTNIEKAAILIVSLGEDMAAEIVRTLPSRDAQRILATASRMKKVDESIVTAVQLEFQQLLSQSSTPTSGGAHAVRSIISKAFAGEQGNTLLKNMAVDNFQSFQDAEHVEAKFIFQILNKEVPQTTAMILAHLSPKKSGEVLSLFNPVLRGDILLRMASLGEVERSVIADVDEMFGKALETIRNRSVSRVGGVDKTAAILAAMNVSQRESVLAALEVTQPETAAAIRSQLWTFEDLAKLDVADMEKLLRSVAASDLELALRSASDTLKARFWRAMSARRAEQVKENIALAKPSPVAKIEDAQRRIASLAAQLISSGELKDPSEEAV